MRKGELKQEADDFSEGFTGKQAHSAGVLAALIGFYGQKRTKKAGKSATMSHNSGLGL